MTSSLDNFARSFDSIKVDRATAPTPEAFDHAISIAGPTDDAFDIAAGVTAPETAPGVTPGFYLVDDAHGRFVIDQTSGVISLKDEAILAQEFGAVHEAHIKVVEISGAFYDMKFRLRLTGRVPQMQGSSENDALAALAAAPIPDVDMPMLAFAAPAPVAQPWLAFAATGGALGKAPLHGETAPFGTLFAGPLLPAASDETVDLGIADALPAPAKAIADWALETA